jgi:hypothetical protein
MQRIMTMQGPEKSMHPLKRNHPLYWMLDDFRDFGKHYIAYSATLARAMNDLGVKPAGSASVEQFIDCVHALWLHPNIDYGVLSYACQLQLGFPHPEIPDPRRPIGRKALTPGDLCLDRPGRRHIWREGVLRAKPANEIKIDENDMRHASDVLDAYFTRAG